MGNLRRKATNKRRRNNKNNNIKKMKYAFSSKVQKLGPGKKLINIDKEVVGQNGAIGLTLNEIISGNEFATTIDNYNLVKVNSIQIVGYPNDNANNKPTYINLDCFGDINGDNIGQSERTKIIYNDTKRPVFYNFRLPGIMRNGQKINSVIPREFFLDIMNTISLKVITPDTNEEVRLRVVIRCEFRVPRIHAVSNRIEVRHTKTDLTTKKEEDYQKRFSKEDLEKIKINNKKNKINKTPKLKIEEEELKKIEDPGVAAETSNLEENNKINISGESEKERSEVQEQSKNKKKNRKKKDKKKEKKLNEKQTPDVKKKERPDFQSLFKKERQMVREEQLKEDAKEIPSDEESKALHYRFYNMYYKIRNCETPYKSFCGFEKDLDDWKESDELVGEMLYTYDPEDFDNPTLRRIICNELKAVAKKRGYNDIF